MAPCTIYNVVFWLRPGLIVWKPVLDPDPVVRGTDPALDPAPF